MTSGQFASIAIGEIWVDRAKRQRRDLERIPDLAASISRSGLINPPVIRRTGELVAGERRLEACKSLGWTHIPCQYIEDLPEHEVHLVELEENIRRVDLPWQDQVKAVQEYHRLRKSQDREWSQAKTADSIGMSRQTVSQMISVAEELEKGNARVVAAPKYSTAMNITTREAERKRTSIINAVAAKPMEDIPIFNEDFHNWSASYTGEPFNLIHCDFPYGINADNQDQGQAVAEHGGYADSEEIYWALMNTLAVRMNTIVAESAHLLFWFSMDYYEDTRRRLTEMGWRVQPHPLIWFKSDNTGLLPDPARGPRRVYETCFLASRGDRKIIQAVSNVVASPVVKEHHMSEKPLPVLHHFFRMLVDEYTTILDPTCGSANALIAAKKLKASRIVGIERDTDFADRARQNWRSAFHSDGASNDRSD